jgi:hypothetical protein
MTRKMPVILFASEWLKHFHRLTPLIVFQNKLFCDRRVISIVHSTEMIRRFTRSRTLKTSTLFRQRCHRRIHISRTRPCESISFVPDYWQYSSCNKLLFSSARNTRLATLYAFLFTNSLNHSLHSSTLPPFVCILTSLPMRRWRWRSCDQLQRTCAIDRHDDVHSCLSDHFCRMPSATLGCLHVSRARSPRDFASIEQTVMSASNSIRTNACLINSFDICLR